MKEKIIIVPKARPAVDFASNLLVIPKEDFDEYVKEIDRHHVEFIRSLESSWNITADDRAVRAAKMVKEKYEEIIAKKDKVIAELKDEALQYKVLDKEHCRDLNTQERFFAKQIAHNKYKRCLVIAKWCLTEKVYFHYRYDDWGDKGYDRSYKWKKVVFWSKWARRWLELAEKFKEAK